jgi:hypothetical protein
MRGSPEGTVDQPRSAALPVGRAVVRTSAGGPALAEGGLPKKLSSTQRGAWNAPLVHVSLYVQYRRYPHVAVSARWVGWSFSWRELILSFGRRLQYGQPVGLTHGLIELLHNVRVIPQEVLGVFAPLAEQFLVRCEPVK